MADHFHIDYESFSKIDITDLGAWRYASDASTELLMAAVAKNDEEPRLWLPAWVEEITGLKSDPGAWEWLVEAFNPDSDAELWAHNAQFEMAMTHYRAIPDLGLPAPDVRRWRCTAAVARKAALPASLGPCAEALGLEQQKDKRGKALIDLFCKPQRVTRKQPKTRISPADNLPAFLEFCGYCRQDVRTEQAIGRALRPFHLQGAMLRSWQSDALINKRGVPVNVQALRNTQRMIELEQAEQGATFQRITGLNYTQRDRVLEWFEARGYKGGNMQAQTVAESLADTSWANGDDVVLKALQLKADLSYSAVSKVTAMLECECGDGRVRGTLRWYGAGTGRWAAELIQPQNLKRPTMKQTGHAYAMLCEIEDMDPDALRVLYGQAPLDVIASCIRHFVQLPDGQQMYDADYAGIEARIVCWLAGQLDALERFAQGIDSYVAMARVIFSRRPEEVSKDERWVGKQTVLGCGFQMGSDRFYDQLCDKAPQVGLKFTITPELCEAAVAAFREQYDKVADLWWDSDRAARNAILHPGKTFSAGPYLKFTVVTVAGMPFLAMRLPSGRSIVYPRPALEDDPRRPGKTKITFWGRLPMKSRLWGRISTYGGKLVENATQGCAGDIMAHGASNALDAGFDVFMLVHDQALAGADSRPVEDFVAELERLPAWAEGLPIKAEGKLVPYYLKL